MTENGDLFENAIAERLNGIIKNEFSLYSSQFGFEETAKLIEKSINAYNQLRPHDSCDYLTPDQAHQKCGKLKKRRKNYYKKNVKQYTYETTCSYFRTTQGGHKCIDKAYQRHG